MSNSGFEPIACQECGQLHRYRPVASGKTALCSRCGGVLYSNRPRMLDEVLALTLAGLILFVLTNVFPLLGLRAQGAEQDLHLFGASVAFWDQGYHLVSGLIIFNILFFPLFELLAILVVLFTIRYRWESPVAIFLFRWMREFKPWGMLEEAGIIPNGEHALEAIEDAVAAVYKEMGEKGLLDKKPETKQRATA